MPRSISSTWRATPVYLGGDEAHFGVVADAIARTGRNLRGDFLPLFVNLADPLGEKAQPWGDTWYQPFLFYLTALAVKLLPFSEAAVRAPAAFLGGVVSPLLMYLVAMRLLGNRLQAIVAALVLALAPAHLILSRQALDYICPLPFVLAWLWCLISFVQTGRIVFAAAGGLLLGVGCYSYIASWAMMPIYLALSWFVFYRAGHGFSKPAAAATIGFALPVVVLIPWLWMNPQMLRETVARYSRSDVEESRPRTTGAAGIAQSTRRRAGAYVSYFNPVTLFVRGGPSMTTSTARTGMFLLPVAVWLPAGLYVLWPASAKTLPPPRGALRRTSRRGRLRDAAGIHWVLLAGLLTAPIPAALKGEPRHGAARPLHDSVCRAHQRDGFRADVAGEAPPGPRRHDARSCSRSRSSSPSSISTTSRTTSSARRSITIRSRSATSRRTCSTRNRPPAYYFADDLDDASAKWRFYTIKHSRQELLARTRYVPLDGPEPAIAPGGSFLVMYVERSKAGRASASRAVDGRQGDQGRRPARGRRYPPEGRLDILNRPRRRTWRSDEMKRIAILGVMAAVLAMTAGLGAQSKNPRFGKWKARCDERG